MYIKIDGRPLDLPAGFALEVTDSSPVYNDEGSQTVSATVPPTANNGLALGFPWRVDCFNDPNLPAHEAEVADGGYLRRGLVNVTEAGPDGVTFNIGFDNSTAYARWKSKTLKDLDGLPVYTPVGNGAVYPVDRLLEDMLDMAHGKSRAEDLTVFPVAVDSWEIDGKTYWAMLNAEGADGLCPPESVTRQIDGAQVEVKLPEGYGVTAFVAAWRVVELVMADLGLTVTCNALKDDADLRRVFVLNNTADAACDGTLDYADLMPDCTVEEFLNALWVRFGMVYDIDSTSGTVEIRLLRDILSADAPMAVEPLASSVPGLTYQTRKYLKLSASTSIDGAAPGTDRFEDFAGGVDVASVHLGADVSQWRMSAGTDGSRTWDGDVRDDFNNDDRDDDRDEDDDDRDEDDDDRDEDDDDRDDGREAAVAKTGSSTGGSFLAREFVTGMWYRLDETNGSVKASSSSFFAWDPQSTGLDAEELTSADECVPVMAVSTVGTRTANDYNGYCPAYLVGSRHYHSYITDSDDDADSTPLAFMQAYTIGGKTIGRLCPEGADGKAVTLDDGSTPGLSLFFQFADGLFAKFWKRYDEILRHGDRALDVDVMASPIDLRGLKALEPVTCHGIKCLIDTAEYSLPSGHLTPVALSLRSISTQGDYDIDEEQGIPAFSTTRRLAWFFLSDDLDAVLASTESREAALAEFKASSGYEPHGTDGDYWYVDLTGVLGVSIAPAGTTWDTDDELQKPVEAGRQATKTYQAAAVYDIYEIHDLTTDRESPGPFYLSDRPIGSVTITVDYHVVIVTRWVAS